MAIKWQLLDVLAAIIYHITCQADYMCRTTVLASYFLAATYLLLCCVQSSVHWSGSPTDMNNWVGDLT